MGKSTISMAISIAMLVYQRVQKTMVLYEKSTFVYPFRWRKNVTVPDREILHTEKGSFLNLKKKVNLKHKKVADLGHLQISDNFNHFTKQKHVFVPATTPSSLLIRKAWCGGAKSVFFQPLNFGGTVPYILFVANPAELNNL